MKNVKRLIEQGYVIKCRVDVIFRHNKFFKPDYSSSFDGNQTITVKIQFSNIMNTLLPTDYVGKGHTKMGQIIELIHRSISRKQAARPDSRVTQSQPGVAVEATIQEQVTEG